METLPLRSGLIRKKISKKPNYVVASINDLVNINSNNQEKCPICCDVMESTNCNNCNNLDQQTYVIPECKHKFHTNCLMQWFRNNPVCPICRANSHQYSSGTKRMYGPQVRKGKIEALRKVIKQKSCPINLRRRLDPIFKKYDKLLMKIKEQDKEIKNEKRKQILTNYSERKKIINKLITKKWKIHRKCFKIEGEMLCYNISEILICKNQK